MKGILGALVAVTFMSGGIAHAGTITGTLQEDFQCPGANCTTTCAGPVGPLKIDGYRELSAWTIGQPDRLWLQKTDQANNMSVIVLGVADHCEFGGTPLTIGVQPQVSSLGPPPQSSCVCMGTQCIPEGCNHR